MKYLVDSTKKFVSITQYFVNIIKLFCLMNIFFWLHVLYCKVTTENLSTVSIIFIERAYYSLWNVLYQSYSLLPH